MIDSYMRMIDWLTSQ